MDNLKFYHISRDASDECSTKFLENGILAGTGIGYGGQKKGFYVWTNEQRANTYFQSLVSEEDAEWANYRKIEWY